MRVVLGVSGGIAAYKAADLVSRLVKRGDAVRVVMTVSATRFVTPLTFEALSGHPVMTDALAAGASRTPSAHSSPPTPLFPLLAPPQAGAFDTTSPVDHVAWAKWAEVAIVAPMTANTLARLACGLADDALSTVFMALPARVPCLVAPAMNTAMWEHPAVQRNLGWLLALGRYRVIPPTHKRLACGDVGVGGLAEVDDLVAALAEVAPTAPGGPPAGPVP